MEKIEEKVKKIFQKFDVQVDDDYIENAVKDKERVKDYMRLYQQEEIDSMNDILGKEYNNLIFSQEELEFVSKIDLFDRNMIEIAKMIWQQKDKPKMLKIFLKIVQDTKQLEYAELIKSLNKESEVVA